MGNTLLHYINFGVFQIGLCGFVIISISLCHSRLLSFSTLDWPLELYFQNCIAIFILYFLLCTRDKTHNIDAYIEMAECHNVSQSITSERMPPCCCIWRPKEVHFPEIVLLL